VWESGCADVQMILADFRRLQNIVEEQESTGKEVK